MDKKSFLRGFGTGVLFTALILGISCFIRTSDSSVIRRAKALGMVYEKEDDTLGFPVSKAASGTAARKSGTKSAEITEEAGASEEKTKQNTGTKQDSVTKQDESTKKDSEAKQDESTKKDSETKQDESTKQDSETKKDNEKEIEDSFEKEVKKAEKEFEAAEKEFSIQAGEWSAAVSEKLEAQNIISDADAFDDYLEKNGYSDKIKAGTYEIPSDASYDKIARIITGQ